MSRETGERVEMRNKEEKSNTRFDTRAKIWLLNIVEKSQTISNS